MNEKDQDCEMDGVKPPNHDSLASFVNTTVSGLALSCCMLTPSDFLLDLFLMILTGTEGWDDGPLSQTVLCSPFLFQPMTSQHLWSPLRQIFCVPF